MRISDESESMNDEGTELEITLSLLELDKVLYYIERLYKKWGNKLMVHLRIGGEGVSLPGTVEKTYNIIKTLGGPDQVDYLTATVPGSFLFSADFSDGILRITAQDKNLIAKIMKSWKRVPRHLQASTGLIDTAIIIEGKRFVLSCIDDKGCLFETPHGQPLLNEAYIASRLGKIGMKYILRSFCEWLVASQNKDGGWDMYEHKSEVSSIIPTASAALTLMSSEIMNVAGRIEALQQAIEFLTITEGKQWSWPSSKGTLQTSILPSIAIMLFKKYNGKITKSIQGPIHVDAADLAHFNIILIDYLNEIGIINTQLAKDTYELLYNKFKIYKSVRGKDKIITLTSLIYLSSLCKKEFEPNDLQLLVNKLLSYRNSDGGWPRVFGKRSELTPTIFSLFSYKLLHPKVYF